MIRCIDSRLRSLCWVWVLFILGTAGRGAHAQESEPDAAATALFRRGRELIQQGDWQQGCQKLSASMARFPSASTLMNLARCDDHDGKIASAWTRYQRALTLTRELPQGRRRDELTQLANSAISALEPRLPRLKVQVATIPSGFLLRVAGASFPVDESIPLDSGKHQLSASAPGYKSVIQEVVLKEGEVCTVVVRLEVEVSERGDASTSTRTPLSPGLPSSSQHMPASPESRPVWPWWVGGIGAAATVAAVGFVIDARSQAAHLRDRCGADLVCNEDLSFDPDPINQRKNRDIVLAVGLGAAGVVALSAAVVGLVVTRKDNNTGRTQAMVPMGWVSGSGAVGGIALQFW